MDIYNLLKVRSYDFGMALNYLNILETDLIFLLKIFSQQELETKTHCIELGWFTLHLDEKREILPFLVNIWSVE